MTDTKKKIPVRVLDLALTTQWALLPEALPPILKIAAREDPGIEAVQAELGVALDNSRNVTIRDGVAVVPIVGPIFRRANLFTELSGATSFEEIAADLMTATEDPDVKAILLDIDSPGGSVNGVSETAQLIALCGKKKAIVAHIDGFGASAAYWLAAAATEVVASDTSMIGSIGVIATYDIPDGKRRRVEIVSSQSPHKSVDVLDKGGRKRIQALIDDTAQVFVEWAAEYRGVSEAHVLEHFGQGDVLIAARALEAGMIDSVGTFEQTLSKLAGKPASVRLAASATDVGMFSQYLQSVITKGKTGGWSSESGGWHPDPDKLAFYLGADVVTQDDDQTTNDNKVTLTGTQATDVEIVPPPEPEPVPALVSAAEEEDAMDQSEIDKLMAEKVAAERERSSSINATGEKYAHIGGRELAATAVEAGTSVPDFNQAILDKLAEKEKALKTPAPENLPTHVHDRAVDEPFASIGEQCAAIARATRNPNLTDVRLHELNAATGHSEAVPSEGGFLLQPTFLQGIEKLMHDTGQVLSRVNRREIGANSNSLVYNVIDESSRVDGSRRGGIRGYWVNEAEAPTKSKLKIRQDRLTLEKLAALAYVTEEQLQDTVALTGELNEIVPEELVFKLEDAVVNGTGAGQPLGILTAACTVSVAKETGQAAATVVPENLVKMWARSWAKARANAVWLINQDIEPSLLTMTQAIGTGGVAVYLPPGGLSAAPYGTIFGRPVLPVEYCQTLGTVGDIILASLDQYRVIGKGGVQGSTSMHVKFEEGETAFRFIYRTNGQPMWEKALTPFKGSNTLAPFVSLATRA